MCRLDQEWYTGNIGNVVYGGLYQVKTLSKYRNMMISIWKYINKYFEKLKRFIATFANIYLFIWIKCGRSWFSLGTPVSSINKTDRNDITEIMLKVALKT